MAKKPGQETIYFKPHQVEFFKNNPLYPIQRFTQYAVDNQIEEVKMKEQGYVKKFVKKQEAGR